MITISDSKITTKQKILISLISLVFLIEFVTTIYLYVKDTETTRISGVYKLFFELILISFIRYKKISKLQLTLFFFIILLYLINQSFNPLFFNHISYHISKGSIYYLDRFIYAFVFVFCFLSLKNLHNIARISLRIIEWILLFNAILMILGGAFDIDLFQSYAKSERFGYDGLFNKINETSYLYIILIAHYYYKIIHKKENINKLIIMIMVSFLLGTKAILFFLGSLLLFHLFFISGFKQKFRIIFIPIVVLGILFFTDITSYVFELFPFWKNLGQHYSLTTLLFSKRDLFLMENLAYISENWTIINYWIGGPYYTTHFINIEMDLPDLILFFGIIGAVIYLILLKITYFKNNSFLVNSLLLLVVLTGFLTGGLFLSVIAMLYLYLFKITAME